LKHDLNYQVSEKSITDTDENPYRSPESPADANVIKVAALARWCSIASLICAIGSVVAHGLALSYASHAIKAAAAHSRSVDLAKAMGGLDALGFVLLFGSFLAGIPAMARDKPLRSMVLVAFVGAVFFSLLLV
jgi:hypothetical protein